MFNFTVSRLIVAKDENYSGIRAANLINRAAKKMNQLGCHSRYFITKGGFVGFDWPNGVSVTDEPWNPRLSVIRDLTSAALQEIKSLLRHLHRKNLPFDFLTIGIDSFSPDENRSIELVCVIDFEQRIPTFRFTGKSYPITNQERQLYRISDLNTHIMKLGKDRVLILGCHDLNLFSARRAKTASSSRKSIRTEMKKIASKFKPTIVLQHPHTSDFPKTWRLGIAGLKKTLPSVKTFASAGAMVGIREDIHKEIREETGQGKVLDIVYSNRQFLFDTSEYL